MALREARVVWLFGLFLFMDKNYWQEVRRTIFQLAIWGGCVAVSLLYGGQTEKLYGFVLGVATGGAYYLMLSLRIRRSAEMPVAKAVGYMRAGWLVRLILVSLMLLLSVKAPQLDFWSAVAGLLLLQAVIVCNAVMAALGAWLKQRLRV